MPISKIKLREKEVEYTLKKSRRARRLRLTIHCDGSFVITAPRGLSESFIEKFIIQKSAWVLDKLEYFKKFPGRRPLTRGESKKDFAGHKNQALALAQSRIEYFNKFYGFKYRRTTIKNQKTLWGSCSKKGNLNFNYKIARLPPRFADYIVVHEFCHLGEFNHSRKFWSLVARAIPDYSEIRKELRRTGIAFY